MSADRRTRPSLGCAAIPYVDRFRLPRYDLPSILGLVARQYVLTKAPVTPAVLVRTQITKLLCRNNLFMDPCGKCFLRKRQLEMVAERIHI